MEAKRVAFMSDDSDEAIGNRLLGHLLHKPRRTLVLAVATGMAVAQGLIDRQRKDVLLTLSREHVLCDRAVAVILEHWARYSKIGSIDEADFEWMLDKITAIAREQ
jgi:pantoate kinase